MKVLHNIGTFKHSNYNTREQVMSCRERLSFDGIYFNVWENRDLLLNRAESTLLFVMIDYIGKDNKFDAIPNHLPVEKYCDWDDLHELERYYNCVIGWHTKSHRDLTQLTIEEIEWELTLPKGCRPSVLAYPHGKFDERVIGVAKRLGYTDAFTVEQGNDSAFQRKRSYLI